MHFFLSARHWVLFTIMFAIPTVIYFITITYTIATENPVVLTIVFPSVMIFTIMMLFAWIWSIGNGLYRFTPSKTDLNNQRFRNLLFFVIAYILIILISMLILFAFNYDTIFAFIGGTGIFIIAPLHIFSMICVLYALYYDARTIRSIELKRPPEASEYLVEMILLWIWPIGIWILQPRINAIYAGKDSDSIADDKN